MEMTMEQYAQLVNEEEKQRQEHPCCANCRFFYTDYGADFCKFYDFPKEDVANDKCSEWC